MHADASSTDIVRSDIWQLFQQCTKPELSRVFGNMNAQLGWIGIGEARSLSNFLTT